MPRTARSIEAGMIYHVLNRGNGRMRLFHKEGDYDAFERVLSEGLGRYSVDMLGRRNWTRLVNGGLAPEELRTLRQCLARGRPLGSLPWVQATAARLGLGFTLRNAGRPPKNLNNRDVRFSLPVPATDATQIPWNFIGVVGCDPAHGAHKGSTRDVQAVLARPAQAVLRSRCQRQRQRAGRRRRRLT